MNFSLIKDLFTCYANLEESTSHKINSFFSTYPQINLFSLFKQLSQGSTPQLNHLHMKKYMTQFNNNLQIVDPNDINLSTNSKDLGSKIQPTDTDVIQKGIALFLDYWGNSMKGFSFAEFSKFMKGEEFLPEKAEQIPYHAKKKLYEIFQTQIQGLLNIQTLRQVCFKEYRNLTDLFEVLASKQTNQINKSSLKNLYLLHSERMDDAFLNRLEKRLRLPMSFQDFIQILKKNQADVNPKIQERKVFYSSARRKKTYDHEDYFDEDNFSSSSHAKSSNFQTPQTQKVRADRGITSTKLTKGQKITQLKQASVNVSKFKLTQTPEKSIKSQPSEYQRKEIEIMGQILVIQQSFIQLKRNLCLRKDFDLELVYERYGIKFENLLNKVYGACNFTAFVRFIVPQDFEHRYLSFVRHETSNSLSEDTQMLIDEVVEAYERKQTEIEVMWSKIDREMLFRVYCNPCDEQINGQELNKYFTERESRVLLDRMDPLKSGYIQLQNFR